MWLKYSDSEIALDQRRQYEQPDLGKYAKPHGFWITDDSEYCWRSWCVSNDFGLDRLTHRHEVEIDEARVLFLRSGADVWRFTRDHGVNHSWQGSSRTWTDRCIDWRAVAKQYAGLIITPYIWECRLGEETSWYYGWDCASGCIWDASAILSVRLRSVEPLAEAA